MSDSINQAFRIPQDKKEKFTSLREGILASKVVDTKTLQIFAGKALSFSLAIPGCRLHVREVFKAISNCNIARTSRMCTVTAGSLYDEIAFWRFLDTWTDCLPWRSERHLAVIVFCDASRRALGGVLARDGSRVEVRDYFENPSDHINM